VVDWISQKMKIFKQTNETGCRNVIDSTGDGIVCVDAIGNGGGISSSTTCWHCDNLLTETLGPILRMPLSHKMQSSTCGLTQN